MRPALLLLPLMLAMPALAAPAVVEIRWSADGGFAHRADVPAGRFLELCGALPQGARVDWRYDAGAPVDFNIHFHRGKEVVVPAEATASTAGADTLAVAEAQEYCWMWTNKNAAPVRVAVRLKR